MRRDRGGNRRPRSEIEPDCRQAHEHENHRADELTRPIHTVPAALRSVYPVSGARRTPVGDWRYAGRGHFIRHYGLCRRMPARPLRWRCGSNCLAETHAWLVPCRRRQPRVRRACWPAHLHLGRWPSRMKHLCLVTRDESRAGPKAGSSIQRLARRVAAQCAVLWACPGLTEGIIARFRTMAITRTSVLTGQVLAVASALGFRPTATAVE